MKYENLCKKCDYKTVNRGIGEYPNKEPHTNRIVDVFSYFKRMIIRIYHYTSDKRINKYLDVFCFRFNSRKLSENRKNRKFT